MGYIYQADIYCEVCGAKICAQLRTAGKAPEDEMETRSYDSYDFPKPTDVEHDESDSPEHCAQCKEFLYNLLTSVGYKYVQERLNDSGEVKLSKLSDVLGEWASWYGFLYWDDADCGPMQQHQKPGWYSGEMY